MEPQTLTLLYCYDEEEYCLTVSFGSIFQTEGDGEHGVILKKLCGERVPPEIVTILVEGRKKKKRSLLFLFCNKIPFF